MKDYHDLYLKCDVLLLADVFEIFKNNCLKNDRLCPTHHLSATFSICDAILNMKKVLVNKIMYFIMKTYNSIFD